MGRCALQGSEEGEEARRGETMMRGWEDLGVVDTIYEEEQEEEEEEEEDEEEDGSNSLSLTRSPTSNPTPSHSSSPSLRSLVEAWSQATGCKPTVVVRVHDQSFHLHRDPLASRSAYLRRRLTESPDVIVTPPSIITAEAFSAAARFCYGSEVALTSSKLAAIRVTAEWLEMTADDGGGVGVGLVGRTEEYFEREVAGDEGRAAQVLHTCAGLLPEAAGMAGRCVAALAAAGGADEAWLDDVASFSAEEFARIADAMRAQFGCDHDHLYRIIDYYFKNHQGKLTEEEKSRICHAVDCRKLSHHLLMHLIQNPRLPVRFIVQAMLLDHLHTRRAFLHRAAATAHKMPMPPTHRNTTTYGNMALGAILQRDAVLRQAAHIRATMEATGFRIQSLERDIESMRSQLRWSEEKRAEVQKARSESFRIIRHAGEEVHDEVPVASATKSCNGSSKNGRSLGKKLVHGLKSMFRTSSTKSVTESQGSGGGGDGDGEVVDGKDMRPRHQRNRSFT